MLPQNVLKISITPTYVINHPGIWIMKNRKGQNYNTIRNYSAVYLVNRVVEILLKSFAGSYSA